MKPKRISCLIIVIVGLFFFAASVPCLRAQEDDDETRTSAQFYPYFGPSGFLNAPYVASFGPYGEFYRTYGFINPIPPVGCCPSMFGIHNLFYPVPLQGSGLVYQVPFVQIAPYLGAASFWQSQFPDADWSKVLATHVLGLITLPGLPRLF